MNAVILVHRQADLLEVGGTLGAARRLASRQHGRQEHGNQDGDDRDDDQELDQTKPTRPEFHAGRPPRRGEYGSRAPMVRMGYRPNGQSRVCKSKRKEFV